MIISKLICSKPVLWLMFSGLFLSSISVQAGCNTGLNGGWICLTNNTAKHYIYIYDTLLKQNLPTNPVSPHGGYHAGSATEHSFCVHVAKYQDIGVDDTSGSGTIYAGTCSDRKSCTYTPIGSYGWDYHYKMKGISSSATNPNFNVSSQTVIGNCIMQIKVGDN